MAPRRVLFLSSCVRGGGAGWSLYYLLKHLDRGRIEPRVVVPEQGIFGERFRALDLEVRTPRWLPHRLLEQRFAVHNAVTHVASAALNIGRMGLFVRELVALIERERIELVYCNNMMVKPLGALAAQISGVPCVLHVRNLHERPVPVTFYGSVARLPCVRHIIANSEASAVPYRAVAPHKVTVVHNGVDLEEYATSNSPGKAVVAGAFRRRFELGDAVLVGFTGNLIPRKGVDTLIRAAAEVLRRRENVIVVVLGRVPLGSPEDYGARYQALAAELEVADRIRFLGFVDDVRSAVADWDILVLPSTQEPFGRSIIEAMALQTAVIASRVGGIPEIIEDGTHGLLVEPGNVAQLAERIEMLVDSPASRERLARAGRARIEEQFDVAKLTERIQDLLLDAIS
jgi:glycosyltransferase involved in cell wall biosynthesis